MDATLLSVRHSPSSLHLNCSTLIILITWCILLFQVYFIWSILCLMLCGLASASYLTFASLLAPILHIHGFPTNNRHNSWLLKLLSWFIIKQIFCIFLQSYITIGCQVFLWCNSLVSLGFYPTLYFLRLHLFFFFLLATISIDSTATECSY